ncbi:hypothetical protein HDU97_000458 [Phlyctochytrium planicorne]|nr:hypothetical protein HDU97_000458 [Phlyctochytrium planicorne]
MQLEIERFMSDKEGREEIILKLAGALRKQMNDAFISGFIQAMDGEKDPRNLLVAFDCARLVVLKLNTTSAVNDLFEILFCYFPITFRAPVDDPFGVSPESLKKSLSLLDKLDSSQQSARIDTLQTLTKALSRLNPRLTKDVASKISDLILDTIADQQVSPDELNAVLEAAIECARRLSTDLQDRGGGYTVQTFLSGLVKEIQSALRNSEMPRIQKLAKPIRTLAASIDPANYIIVNAVVPEVLESYRKEPDFERKTVMIGLLNEVLSASKDLNHVYKSQDAAPSPILQYREGFYEIYFGALSTSHISHLRVSITGIANMICIHGLLDDAKSALLIEGLFQLLKSDKNRDLALVSSVITSFVQISAFLPSAVFNIGLGDLVAGYCNDQDSVPPQIVEDFIKEVGASAPSFFLLANQFMKSPHLTQRSAVLLQELISKLSISDSSSDLSANLKTFVFSIFQRSNQIATASEAVLFSKVIGAAVRALNNTEQKEIVVLVGFDGPQDSLPKVQSVLKAGVFSNLRPDVLHSMSFNASAVIKSALDFVTKSSLENEYSQVMSLFSATLLNKMFKPSTDAANQILHDIHLDSDSAFLAHLHPKTASVKHLFWMLRALIIRGDMQGLNLLKTVIASAQSDVIFLQTLLENFGILVEANPSGHFHALTKDDFSVVSPLWKQKLFSFTFKSLIDSEKSTRDNFPISAIYLSLILLLIKNTPTATYSTSMESLIPIVLRSLNLGSPEITAEALLILRTGIDSSPDLFAGYIEQIMESLLRLITLESTESKLTVRLLTVECTGKLASSGLQKEKLVPYKSKIITGLKRRLDDPKRAVRKEAANARSKWYFI